MEYYLAVKKGEVIDTLNNMNESQNNYAGWKKSDIKEYNTYIDFPQFTIGLSPDKLIVS